MIHSLVEYNLVKEIGNKSWLIEDVYDQNVHKIMYKGKCFWHLIKFKCLGDKFEHMRIKKGLNFYTLNNYIWEECLIEK